MCSVLKKCAWLALLLVCLLSNEGQGFTKIVVPAVYKEWAAGAPEWVTSSEIQAKYNYTVFLYQKLDPDAPNYFGFNRGRENGVFLQYIVDHYNSFPDVAVFLHAKPHEHQKNWLEMIGCISPNATYYNINYGGNPWVTRTPAYWYAHMVLSHMTYMLTLLNIQCMVVVTVFLMRVCVACVSCTTFSSLANSLTRTTL